MPLNRQNTKQAHRRTYGGSGLKSVVLLHRQDDQRQGTVTAIKLFDCRRSKITQTGQSLQGSMASGTRCVWHIPACELRRNGIHHLNALDRIREDNYDDRRPLPAPRYWQPEGEDNIDVGLFENMVRIECRRVDVPPGDQGK